MNPEKNAVLYRGPKKVLAYPSNQTVAGFYLAAAPFLTIEEESALSVGVAVRKALTESKTGVSTPERNDYGKISQPRLKAAGVRSESAFMKDARMLIIRKKDDLVITPHQNIGTSGFRAIQNHEIRLPVMSDDLSLGAACLRALALCE